MFRFFKKIFGNRIAQDIFEIIFLVKNIILLILNYKKQKLSNSNSTILIGLIPTHQNLGDYALYISAKKMIADFYPNHTILELKISEMPNKIFHFRNLMNRESDMVFLIGGGNMGSRYLTEEFNRQVIFFFFRNYKRIQLPQSASYESNLRGKIIYKISKFIFEKNHTKMIISSRDQKSYEYFKSSFKVKVVLMPDSVLYLNFQNDYVRKDKVLYCIRDDKESNFDENQKDKIQIIIKDKFQNAIAFDTLNKSERSNEEAFNQLIENIATAKLIITDRLHGLIFSYITNSNVIALPTLDHKLTNFYEWIKDSKKTWLAEDLDVFETLVLQNDFENDTINVSFQNHFLQLKNEIDKL